MASGGGLEVTTNRTYWPTKGGAIAFQPGWFQGHQTAMIYINLGFGTEGPGFGHTGGPPNMSFPMITPFQILGPSKNPYPGTVCLPQVPLPAGAEVKAGDNATIQIVELAVHGAALYSVRKRHSPFLRTCRKFFSLTTMENKQCVDITFVEPGDSRLAEVNETNCFNTTEIGFADVFSLTLRASGQAEGATSGAERALRHPLASYLGYLPVVVGGLWALLM